MFKILSTADQRDSIVDDIRHLVDLNSESLTADLQVATGTGGDASLEEVWQDYGFADAADTAPEPATVTLDVTRCEGSISALTARLSEVLVSRDKQPAEQLFQQVLDDPGTPRVPWHVDIRP